MFETVQISHNALDREALGDLVAEVAYVATDCLKGVWLGAVDGVAVGLGGRDLTCLLCNTGSECDVTDGLKGVWLGAVDRVAVGPGARGLTCLLCNTHTANVMADDYQNHQEIQNLTEAYQTRIKHNFFLPFYGSNLVCLITLLTFKQLL